MSKIERSINIKAPVEAVWNYLEDATHLPAIWPSLMEVKDIKPSPLGGSNYRFVYKMVGVRLEGSSEVAEYEKNKHAVRRSKGGIESTFTWDFRTANGGTKVNLAVEYRLPAPVLSKLAEPFVLKANENEADAFLANLKAVMETQTSPAKA